jgi:hypothetical protein
MCASNTTTSRAAKISRTIRCTFHAPIPHFHLSLTALRYLRRDIHQDNAMQFRCYSPWTPLLGFFAAGAIVARAHARLLKKRRPPAAAVA